MTDCPNAEIRDLLPELMHDRLDAAARARVEAHLATCADCRAELALLRSARAALIAATSRIDAARIARVLPRPAAPRAMRRASAWRSWRIAATVAVLLTGGATLATIANIERGRVGGDSIRIGRIDSGAAEGAGYALTVAGGLSDLSDAELQGLLDGIDDLEALPSDEPDAAVPAAAALGESL